MLTKLDGSAKGGIVVAIREELGIPIKLIGVGERLEDLRPFDPDEFARALFLDDGAARLVSLRLETPRLIVRDYTAADLDDVAEILADPEVFWWVKEPFTREQRALVARRGDGLRGPRRHRPARGRAQRRPARSSAARPRVARPRDGPRDRARLPPAPRLLGPGLRDRGRRGLLEHARELGLRRVISLIYVDNPRSEAVARRLGMSPERELVWAGLPHRLWRRLERRRRARPLGGAAARGGFASPRAGR